MYIACTDSLKRLPEAVQRLLHRALTQLGIVHMVRASLHYDSVKQTNAVAADLKRIYGNATMEETAAERDAF